jgi:hypothetical protein
LLIRHFCTVCNVVSERIDLIILLQREVLATRLRYLAPSRHSLNSPGKRGDEKKKKSAMFEL